MEIKELPLVTIIVPVLNGEKHIKNCLEDILNQNYPRDKIEVFVIDGGSQDNSRNIVKQFIKEQQSFNAVLLDEPGKNVATAFNIGVRRARGEIIMKMDVHTEYELDYISKCIEYFKKTRADCVGGPMKPQGTNYITKAISYAYTASFGSGGGRFHNERYAGYADAVYLGAYKKEVFNKIGGWDEEIIHADDDDFNYRLRRSGGKIYLTPKIKSYYYVRPSLKKLWDQYFKYGYSKVLFIKKHRLLGAGHHIIPSVFVLSLAGSFLLGFVFWPLRALFVLILAMYLTISLLVSLKISFKQGFKYFPILPLVFATLHFSYGIGFLKGVFEAFLIKK